MNPLIFTTYGFDRLLPLSINEMIQCQYGMLIQHPGTCISHHRSDFLSHRGFVAMSWALGARRFPSMVWTRGESFLCVIQELSALRAEPF